MKYMKKLLKSHEATICNLQALKKYYNNINTLISFLFFFTPTGLIGKDIDSN